uniref:NADH-ubiquinone oxidoreductase chain 1 n=1 Tax=Stereobalanus canadensis TaxID=560612 RepID=A0A3S7SFZ7_9BILA|nr:NADH dehydrogenase subunit 1 [Stereobalanus canadensis]AXY64121.1 NADH dehydrogenase subunit 1 [Stereobalanus canadensis]
MHLITPLMHSLILILPVLLSVAFMTLGERKVLGYMQHRKGPNIVGPYGLLQPIADGVKLFIKEPMKPSTASPYLFLACPIIALAMALSLWAPISFPCQFSSVSPSLLLILTLSSISMYTILGSGWSSNSSYALLGSIRAAAQTISYEMSLGLMILSLVVLTGYFNFQTLLTHQTTLSFMFTCAPLALMWFVSSLAETNRAPFDLAEGESELVSGFNVEYAGGPFALFFLAEYANMILINFLTCLLFFGGTITLQILPWTQTIMFAMKTTILAFTFLWVRAAFPRFRYDQLMHLTWKQYLPLTMGMIMFYCSIPTSFLFPMSPT